jgi:hypothetical protein
MLLAMLNNVYTTPTLILCSAVLLQNVIIPQLVKKFCIFFFVGVRGPLGLSFAKNTVQPGYNDIGLYDTSSIASDILWYQLVPHC